MGNADLTKSSKTKMSEMGDHDYIIGEGRSAGEKNPEHNASPMSDMTTNIVEHGKK